MPVAKGQSSYLADRMNEVSRSFALVVASLEEPLHTYMATAYLLCRVADNIEDCGQPSTWRQHRFAQFQRLLEDPAAAATTLAAWECLEWPGLTAPEMRMMGIKGGFPLWEIYAAIDDHSRRSIRKLGVNHGRGHGAVRRSRIAAPDCET